MQEHAFNKDAVSDQYVGKNRYERLLEVLEYLRNLPGAKSGLEAYAQISNALNDFEDCVFGRNSWSPPRSFQDGNRTQRLYPILPENIFPVDGYNGVMLLLAKKELVFISRFGAIEIQKKCESDKYGALLHYKERSDTIVFKKTDYYGGGVWNDKNKE